MLFNSYVFWAFFLLVLVLYRRLGHRNQNRLLLVSSYIFYGLWDWRFLSLILVSTLVDFWVSRRLGAQQDPHNRSQLLWLSMATNLGILGFFKYWNFFAGELTQALSLVGMNALSPTLDLVLPVGISFYLGFRSVGERIVGERLLMGATGVGTESRVYLRDSSLS
jgi:D-alanyl-lipoteichoic acid acyltransferase DltB (MBOAT superfamily)